MPPKGLIDHFKDKTLKIIMLIYFSHRLVLRYNLLKAAIFVDLQ